jgi:hypothetical protein
MPTVFCSPSGLVLAEILQEGIIFDAEYFCSSILTEIVQNPPLGSAEDPGNDWTNARSIMSLVYPERKWIKDRKHDGEKPKLNRTKQISILSRSITMRKPDTRRSGEKEKSP